MPIGRSATAEAPARTDTLARALGEPERRGSRRSQASQTELAGLQEVAGRRPGGSDAALTLGDGPPPDSLGAAPRRLPTSASAFAAPHLQALLQGSPPSTPASGTRRTSLEAVSRATLSATSRAASGSLARSLTEGPDAAEQALAGLCGRGHLASGTSIDWLTVHADRADTQRTLSNWLSHPSDGPTLCRALQQACRRGRLQHPHLVARLLRHAPWEPLLDDPQALSQIGAFITDLEVFGAFVHRESREEARLIGTPQLDGNVRQMALLGLQARRQMLWDSILKPRIESLRAAIVRQGALDLLEPLFAFIPGEAHRRHLELIVRGISLVGLQRSAWLREQLLTAGITLPGRLDAPPEQVTRERIVDQMRTTWRRGMQAIEVAQTLALVRRAQPVERADTLHHLVADPEGLWACSFLAHAGPPETIVELWGAATFDVLMDSQHRPLGCPLLAFGAAIAGVLVERLPAARVEALVVADRCQAVWLALAAGQATLAAQMLARIHDPGHQEELVAEASEALGRGQEAAVRPPAA